VKLAIRFLLLVAVWGMLLTLSHYGDGALLCGIGIALAAFGACALAAMERNELESAEDTP
jgi:hypothetical protein